MLNTLHHIQLAMPAGQEDQARAFYAGVLGLPEVEKPDVLKTRGGVWFERDGLRVHLGVEDPFTPARKAHPAFQVTLLEKIMTQLTAKGVAFTRDIDLPGIRRLHVADPYGNRIEILEVTGAD